MWNAVDMRAGGCSQRGLGTTRTMPAGSFTQDGIAQDISGAVTELCCVVV